MSKRQQNWCNHITWGLPVNSHHEGWVMFLEQTNASVIGVPRNWKVCPICQAERPTNVNRRAAKHRFMMDNDQ